MKKVIWLPLFLLGLCFPTHGQFSSYSSYGFGIAAPWQPVRAVGAGFTGTATRDSIGINNYNPALWTGFTGTSIQGQFYFSSVNIPSQDYSGSYGRLNGVAFKFPLGKRIGVAMGVNPLTRTEASYSFADTLPFEGATIQAQSDLYLTGGLSEFYFGSGFRFTPQLSLGFKLRFIIGDYLINYNTVMRGTNTIYSFWESHTSVSGKTLQVGFLWEEPRARLRLAGSYDQALNSTFNKRINYSYGPDTTFPRRRLDYPTQFQLALSKDIFRNCALNLEWHFSRVPSELFEKFYLFQPLRGHNAHLWGVGLEFTPHVAKDQFDTPGVTYRLGAYYRTEPIYSAGQQVQEQGVTCGLGIPLFNYLNRIDFALIYGLRRGFLGEENFLSLNCGLVTGELWFLKYKRR